MAYGAELGTEVLPRLQCAGCAFSLHRRHYGPSTYVVLGLYIKCSKPS